MTIRRNRRAGFGGASAYDLMQGHCLHRKSIGAPGLYMQWNVGLTGLGAYKKSLDVKANRSGSLRGGKPA
ncbi:hypothetical protein IAQ61_010934 [Plenodomus lingam]|uniref:uncharacterized protein n=1 Tax=Leptosphaeria maculans TaxID=5022 RepID=UPI003321E649|nr:hypothetical protein IAQ61_010934 [Plenodomus lingam]